MDVPFLTMKGSRKTPPSDRERIKRIRLLNAELDTLRVASSLRTRAIETKASFIVLTSGAISSITGPSLVTSKTCFVGLLPLALIIVAVALAAAVLFPRGLSVPSARKMVDQWVNAPMSAEELEDSLLEVKAKEIEGRDGQNERRANLTYWSFILLLCGLFLTVFIIVLNAFSTTMSNHEEAEPTQTSTCTQAPIRVEPTSTP